jgi:FkbH-like protein
MNPQMPTLIHTILRERAANTPDAAAYQFRNGDSGSGALTWAEADAAAERIAAWIGAEHPDCAVAVLACPPGLDFIQAFWACLYAGVIAVPVSPPADRDARLSGIIDNTGAALVLTTSALAGQLKNTLQHCVVADISRIADESTSKWKEATVRASDIAYLQYTSGSTSTPRGVMVTHANVLSNLADIDEAFEHRDGDALVSWLPHFHDMGLVYGVLQPVYSGIPTYLLSPRAFIQNPLAWLQTISAVRGTHSGGPNFAYDHCVRRISPEQCAGLDLSSWRVAFNGAEPVRQDTLVRFAERFQDHGFREDSFYPAYGLAEATLKVSCRTKDRVLRYRAGPSHSTLTSCGRPGSRTQIRIVNPETLEPRGAGEIGEIWVAGSGVAAGYWRDPAQTEAGFRARLGDDGPFLRTGDLGLLDDGELFVAGRIKDLVIVRGVNYYPQDIEQTAELAHPGIRRSCVAAFAIDCDGGEELVILAEVKHRRMEEWSGAAEAIYAAVCERHGVAPHTVALVREGSIARTTSGKVQRRLCRARFLNSEITVVDQFTAPSPAPAAESSGRRLRDELSKANSGEKRALIREFLIGVVSAAIGLTEAAADSGRSLVSLGLDSLKAAQLEAAIEAELGIALPAATLLGGVSIDRLANQLIDMVEEGSANSMPPHTEVPPPQTDMRTSMEQERLFWLQDAAPRSAAYNITASVRFLRDARADLLEQALAEVVRRHEILRTRFELKDGRVVQIPDAPGPLKLPFVDLSAYADPEDTAAALVRRQMATPFDLGRGCFRAVVLRIGPHEHILAITVHHIAADAWSIRILFQEIAELHESLRENRPAALAEPALSFSQYAEWERVSVNHPAVNEDLTYWSRRLSAVSPSSARDRRPTARRAKAGERYSFTISKRTTEQARDCARTSDATLFMTLLAAFGATLSGLLEERTLVVGVPVPGRRHPGAKEAVGPFSYPLPFVVDVPDDISFRELVASVRADALEAYRHQNVPFSQIVHAVKSDAARFRFMLSLLPPLTSADTGVVALSPVLIEPSALDLDLYAAISDAGDRLEATFAYNPDWRDEEWIRKAAHAFVAFLDSGGTEQPRSAPSETSASSDSAPDIVMASTFTADPIAEALSFWLEELELPSRCSIAPYDQVFQQLLDPASLMCANQNLANVVLVRAEDWMRAGADSERLRQDATRFIGAVRLAAARSPAAFLVMLCPASPRFSLDQKRSDLAADLEQFIADELARDSRIHVWKPAQLLNAYPLSGYHDSESEALGNVPYSPEFMAAMGTVLARRIHAIRREPYKAIVLDCDYTLWNGACGEQGPAGVAIEPGHEFLQKFMLAQRDAGMLLCICSRNNPEDVRAIFENDPRMILKQEHLLAGRICWAPKSESIRALSDELGLALSSFIFLDDSPVECAEVRAACPDVLTLQVPRNPEDLPSFLKNVWAFDALSVTEEDRERSTLYRREMRRADEQAHSESLEQFLSTLELEVSVLAAPPERLARVAQLTRRTNQFNLNGARYSEPELETIAGLSHAMCLAVDAKDRFGDYGLVGAAVCQASGDQLRIDGLWLSCRALGRGVESKFLAEIGAIASARRLNCVTAAYQDTGRNAPIRMFLEQLGSIADRSETGTVFRFDPASLAACKTLVPRPAGARTGEEAAPRGVRTAPFQLVERIAAEWSDPARVLQAVRARRRSRKAAGAGVERTEIEAALAAIWAEVLGADRVNPRDDFFALGGDSLLAVQTLALINRKFGIELPIDVFFESEFTVADLAAGVERYRADAAGVQTATL